MEITITLGELIFLLVGLAELGILIAAIRSLTRGEGPGSASGALLAIIFMSGWLAATFFLYAGIYLW